MSKVIRNMMKAIRVSQFGGPEVLKVEEIPIPHIEDNQVLVKVFSAGVNPIDTYLTSGPSTKLPYTPGFDAAGTVETVGKNVKRFKQGDRVFSIKTVTGAYAEYCVLEEDCTVPLHDNLTFEQGAGLGIPYYTAYKATVMRANAKPGETILVHGASGAVGIACVQLARHMGLKVIGTAGSKAGMDLVNANGADIVIDHKSEGYTQKIMDVTNGEGPDIIIEMLANVNLEKDLTMISKKGRIVNVGSRGTIEISPRFTLGKECIVTGVMILNCTPSEWKELHAAIQAGMRTGWVNPHVGKIYSLDKAGDAHRDIINNSGSQGKLVIKL